MDQQNGIGLGGKLPWRISTDLRRFKQITTGHHIITGRKTFESIGRPLPGRKMIIVSRNSAYTKEGCIVVHSLDQGLAIAENNGENEVFVIGGGELFKHAIKIAQRVYLTVVHTIVDADVFFPEIDWSKWSIVKKLEFDGGNEDQYPHTFMILDRENIDQTSNI